MTLQDSMQLLGRESVKSWSINAPPQHPSIEDFKAALNTYVLTGVADYLMEPQRA